MWLELAVAVWRAGDLGSILRKLEGAFVLSCVDIDAILGMMGILVV